jgi:hypothetical protein
LRPRDPTPGDTLVPLEGVIARYLKMLNIQRQAGGSVESRLAAMGPVAHG